MILILCVDDRFGMLFNGRRLSSDSAVTNKILALSKEKRLWMNCYSQDLFPETDTLCVCDDFLEQAPNGDYCFVETVNPEPYLERAEKVILFHWNRNYPADLHFPIKALESGWHIVDSVDFPGTSHERISMEVYSR